MRNHRRTSRFASSIFADETPEIIDELDENIPEQLDEDELEDTDETRISVADILEKAGDDGCISADELQEIVSDAEGTLELEDDEFESDELDQFEGDDELELEDDDEFESDELEDDEFESDELDQFEGDDELELEDDDEFESDELDDGNDEGKISIADLIEKADDEGFVSADDVKEILSDIVPDEKQILSDELCEDGDCGDEGVSACRYSSLNAPGIEDTIGDEANGGDASTSKLKGIISRIDRVANYVQKHGHVKLAKRLDMIANTLQARI